MHRRAEVFEADLAEAPAARALVQKAIAALGPIHVLVNNAAVIRRARFLEYRQDDWDETIAVNLRAAFLCAQEAARAMVAQRIRGRIINLSSVGAIRAHSDLCAYDASKAAIETLTRSIAVALAAHGITVNSVSPGAIAVERNKDEFAGAEAVQRWKSAIPLGHWGRPEDIAGAVMYLASEEAGFVTGHTLVVDGGQTITLACP